MKSNILRPTTIQRLSYVYYFSDPKKVALQEVIEWIEKVYNIKIWASLGKFCDGKLHWEAHMIINGKEFLALPWDNFPYRSTKYNLKNDRLEDGINAALLRIDKTLFDNYFLNTHE